MASKLQKQPKLVQKNNKKFVYCTSFDYLCGMIMDLEHIGNIPVSTATVASLFPEMSAGNQKVLQLETAGKVIRLKRGLYVIAPRVSRVSLSTELIANHLYAPSYVSRQTALRYYGLIPEAVYTTQSMTIKHSRHFDTRRGKRKIGAKEVIVAMFYEPIFFRHGDTLFRQNGTEKLAYYRGIGIFFARF